MITINYLENVFWMNTLFFFVFQCDNDHLSNFLFQFSQTWRTFLRNSWILQLFGVRWWRWLLFSQTQMCLRKLEIVSLLLSMVVKIKHIITTRSRQGHIWYLSSLSQKIKLRTSATASEISSTPFGRNFMNSLWQFESRWNHVQRQIENFRIVQIMRTNLK